MLDDRTLIGTTDVLAAIEAALNRADHDRSGLTDHDRLDLADRARILAGRMDALLCALIAEADRFQSAMKARGTPTTSWLSLTGNWSMRESAGLLLRAQALAEHPAVHRAALSGRIGASQARAICQLLGELPPDLTDDQRAHGERSLLEHAQQLDAPRLLGLAEHLLREIAPDAAAESNAQRLERQAQAAHRQRSLSFVRDHRGSVRFRGSLPVLDAEPWVALIDAYAQGQRRTFLEARDPFIITPTPEQRRADVLIAMVTDLQRSGQAPRSGSDLPRVVVTVSHDELVMKAAERGLLTDGHLVGAGDLRRICCDAEVMPAVLGGASEILDLGRSRRLVNAALRSALTLRDGGCVFPGCDTHASACDAHHVDPWWNGGMTALSNLALLCHHHHSLVEPDRSGVRDQWLIQIGADGAPEAIPPRRVDAEQVPIRHQRFEVRRLRVGSPAMASASTGGPSRPRSRRLPRYEPSGPAPPHSKGA